MLYSVQRNYPTPAVSFIDGGDVVETVTYFQYPLLRTVRIRSRTAIRLAATDSHMRDLAPPQKADYLPPHMVGALL